MEVSDDPAKMCDEVVGAVRDMNSAVDGAAAGASTVQAAKQQQPGWEGRLGPQQLAENAQQVCLSVAQDWGCLWAAGGVAPMSLPVGVARRFTPQGLPVACCSSFSSMCGWRAPGSIC